METENGRVKIEQQTRNTIETVEIETDRQPSFRQFLRSAVEANVRPMKQKLAGQQTTIKLTNILRDIDGIEQEELGSPIKPRWGKDDFLESSLTFEIDKDSAEDVTEIAHTTTLSDSDVYRAAIFFQLALSANEINSAQIHDWERSRLIGKWLSIQKGLTAPRREFTDILSYWFTDYTERTMQILENDLGRFNRFAEAYHDDFYDTDCYERIKEESEEDPLNDVENVIEEMTKYSFSKGSIRLFNDIDT